MLDHVRQSTNVFGTADALEIFLNVSNVFVLANMLEFALVGILSRKSHVSDLCQTDILGNKRK